MKIHGLELDDEITIAAFDRIIPAHVQARGSKLVVRLTLRSGKSSVVAFDWSAEGSRWCRGHTGPAVDALKTVMMLSESTK